MAKISYENWLSSAQKWVGIKEKVKRKERFTLHRNGFRNLFVTTPCGYCEEFEGCESCALFLKRIADLPICYHDMNLMKTHFSSFVLEMRKKEPKFEAALFYTKIILDAILKDCPDKDRAIQDGVKF